MAVAVKVIDASVEPPLTVMLKFAVVAPEGTVTVAGTVATLEEEFRATERPAAGAAAVRVTVPTEVPEPVIVVGRMLRAETPGAVTAIVVVLDTPFPVAVIVADAFVVPPATPVTVKVVVAEPAGTVTDEGTVATAVLLEVSATVVPAPPALPVRVTVPVEVEP